MSFPTRLSRAMQRRVRRITSAPPPVVDDPRDAFNRGFEKAAFHCALDHCSEPTGMEIAPWSAFVATAAGIKEGSCSAYHESPLKRLHEAWRPRDAAEAIPGFDNPPRTLQDLPPYLFYMKPWSKLDPSRVAQLVRRFTRRDNVEHGYPHLTLEHGVKHFGPIHPEIGEMEFHRLHALVASISDRGYDRRMDIDVSVESLVRGGEWHHISSGGLHRMAVMRAFGKPSIAARPKQIIDVSQVDDWPQVKSGLWDRGSAVRYFHHRFDFDSREWARIQGIMQC